MRVIANIKKLVLCCLILGCLSIQVFAVDIYYFESTNPDEFYQTGITTVTYDGAIPGYVQNLYDFTPMTAYTSEYGATVIAPQLNTGYGFISEAPTNVPGNTASSSTSGSVPLAGSSTNDVVYPEILSESSTSSFTPTPITDVRKSDGSIGALKIPAIGLSVTAYDGELTSAMNKGVGHIDSTSGWIGNIGLVGHNRGVNTNFGKLKNLAVGDEITYTTTLGTRTYVVTLVQKISANDWSYLQYTSDNRITLITCVEDQPDYRLCVQAVEKQ